MYIKHSNNNIHTRANKQANKQTDAADRPGAPHAGPVVVAAGLGGRDAAPEPGSKHSMYLCVYTYIYIYT